jgi:hypothetical protein
MMSFPNIPHKLDRCDKNCYALPRTELAVPEKSTISPPQIQAVQIQTQGNPELRCDVTTYSMSSTSVTEVSSHAEGVEGDGRNQKSEDNMKKAGKPTQSPEETNQKVKETMQEAPKNATAPRLSHSQQASNNLYKNMLSWMELKVMVRSLNQN